ncbi:MAG: hypothetical protein AAF993_19490, partial [Pseudomonadota bacterium]
MSIPSEFTPESVAQAAQDVQDEGVLYGDFVTSGEPYRSLLRANPWIAPPKRDKALVWGEGRYYDTTVARKHDYWRDQQLPEPTKDISRLRRDFKRWGYCLIEAATSAVQTAVLRERVAAQAAAERALGIAYLMEAQQHVWSLVNKGEVFVRCMSHESDAVQAGPLIEQLLDEALGPGWHHLIFISNVSYPGCRPQAMHHDLGLAGAYPFLHAPFLVN